MLLCDDCNIVVFVVDINVNKIEICKVVEFQFKGVKVVEV